MTASASVLLPLPLSPTNPTVSPASTWTETSRTAGSGPTAVSNSTCNPWMSSIGRAGCRATATASGISRPRIDPRVEHVRAQVEHGYERGRHQHRAHDHRLVVERDRL